MHSTSLVVICRPRYSITTSMPEWCSSGSGRTQEATSEKSAGTRTHRGDTLVLGLQGLQILPLGIVGQRHAQHAVGIPHDQVIDAVAIQVSDGNAQVIAKA